MQLYNPAIKSFLFCFVLISRDHCHLENRRQTGWFIFWEVSGCLRSWHMFVFDCFITFALICLFDQNYMGVCIVPGDPGTGFSPFYRGSQSWFYCLLSRQEGRREVSCLIRTKAWKLSHLRTSSALSRNPLTSMFYPLNSFVSGPSSIKNFFLLW